MNLLVADHIASGKGFSWDYGGHTVSPIYIQTSGLFLLIAAGAMHIFGISWLALQLANLLFLGLLLTAVGAALRPWRGLHVLGPTIVFLGIPAITILGLGGYGEVPVAALMVLSFLMFSIAAEQPQRAPALCVAGATAMGVSLSIKVITIAEIPALAIGVVVVAICHPQLSRLRLLLGQLLGLVVPVAAFEAYRLQQFGSLHGWTTYWSAQIRGVGNEAAGTQPARPNMANTPHGWIRLHSLGGQLGLDSPAYLLVLLYLPLIFLLVMFVRRNCGWREWVSRPRHLLAVMLSCVVFLYIPWYVFVSPIVWLRHALIGLIALVVLYPVTIGIGLSEWRTRRRDSDVRRSNGLNLTPAYVSLVSLMVILGFLRVAAENVVTTTSGLDPAGPAVVAASYASQLHHRGTHVCGLGAMSAPVVSVLSHIDLCDLDQLNPCSASIRHALANGEFVLVFDLQAQSHYPEGPPDSPTFTYQRLAAPSSYATFWQVELRPGVCH